MRAQAADVIMNFLNELWERLILALNNKGSFDSITALGRASKSNFSYAHKIALVLEGLGLVATLPYKSGHYRKVEITDKGRRIAQLLLQIQQELGGRER